MLPSNTHLRTLAVILHLDFPQQVKENPDFALASLTVCRDYLRNEGPGERFLGLRATQSATRTVGRRIE